MNIDISIIVPVYNVESYLEQCIKSLLIGNELNFEFILINDGSTDSSGKIIDYYSSKDERIITIHQQNKGLSAARNRGLNVAKGKYIIFVDSDDWIEMDSVCKLYKTAILYDLELIRGVTYERINEYESGIIKKNVINSSMVDKVITGTKCFNGLMAGREYRPMVANYLYKNELIKENKFRFKKVLHEDELWLPIVLASARKVMVTNIYFYNYRINREGSIMNSSPCLKRIYSYIEVANYLTEYNRNKDNGISFSNWLIVIILRLYHWAFWLLSTQRDSTIIINYHYVYKISNSIKDIDKAARTTAESYTEHIKSLYKEHLKWKNILLHENKSIPQVKKNIILIFNNSYQYPLKMDFIFSNYITTQDRKYFYESQIVFFFLPTLFVEMDSDLVKQNNQKWISWTYEATPVKHILDDAEIMDAFDSHIVIKNTFYLNNPCDLVKELINKISL